MNRSLIRTSVLALSLALAPLALAPRALTAQAGGAIFPSKPLLDPARLHVRNVLLVLRDSLLSVNSAAARLQRDYRSTSAEALSGHARGVAASCASSARNVVPARDAVRDGPLTTRAQQRAQVTLLRMLDSLNTAVTRCQAEFAAMGEPGKGEEVRGYGNRTLEPILGLLMRYDQAATGYFKVYDMDVDPIGTRPNPLAS